MYGAGSFVVSYVRTHAKPSPASSFAMVTLLGSVTHIAAVPARSENPVRLSWPCIAHSRSAGQLSLRTQFTSRDCPLLSSSACFPVVFCYFFFLFAADSALIKTLQTQRFDFNPQWKHLVPHTGSSLAICLRTLQLDDCRSRIQSRF